MSRYLLLLSLLVGPAIASNRDLQLELEHLEARERTSRPGVSQAFVLAGTASVLYLAVGDEDEEISRHISSESSPFDRSATNFGRSLGEMPLNFGILSAIGVYGFSRSDAIARNCALDGFASAALGEGLLVPAVKVLFGRDRPSLGKGSHSYDFIDGGRSFPSGHTALAFSLAGTVHAWYPDWRGWMAIALASSTAYSRVHTLSHWPSDVIAGAFIGFGTATYVARSRFRERLPSILPVFTRDYAGASVGTRF